MVIKGDRMKNNEFYRGKMLFINPLYDDNYIVGWELAFKNSPTHIQIFGNSWKDILEKIHMGYLEASIEHAEDPDNCYNLFLTFESLDMIVHFEFDTEEFKTAIRELFEALDFNYYYVKQKSKEENRLKKDHYRRKIWET